MCIMSAFFSKSDKSRSIPAKRSAFSIKIWSAPTHLRKSGLATPICAAGRRRCLFSVYHRHHEYSWRLWCLLVKEGVVCDALCTVRRRDTTPTTTRKICVFFFATLDRSRLTNLDLSDFEKERTQWHSLCVLNYHSTPAQTPSQLFSNCSLPVENFHCIRYVVYRIIMPKIHYTRFPVTSP